MITISKQEVQVLPVMEHFYTIQGEGFHQGKAAYFIRLGGCDVGCAWCDVKESWDAAKHPAFNVNTIVGFAEQGSAGHAGEVLAVITGGEPLMHNLDQLTEGLKEKGFHTNIETSGSHPLSGHWDWICLSPKKFKAPLPEVTAAADELKVVVFNRSDFAWAEQYAAQVKESCLLFLQPEWSKAAEMMPMIVEYVKLHPRWRISLQVHKYMNVP